MVRTAFPNVFHQENMPGHSTKHQSPKNSSVKKETRKLSAIFKSQETRKKLKDLPRPSSLFVILSEILGTLGWEGRQPCFVLWNLAHFLVILHICSSSLQHYLFFFLDLFPLCSFLILPSNQTSKPLLSSICACDCDKNDDGSNDEENAYTYLYVIYLSLYICGLVEPLSYSLVWSLSHVWLCNPVDCSPPGSSVHEISQARILRGLLFPSLRAPPDPGIEPGSLALQADPWPTEPPGKTVAVVI